VEKAFQKRPVSHEAIQDLVSKVVSEIAAEYDTEVPWTAIGEKVMAALREVDEVAYVRYASVYRRFQEPTDFVQVVKRLETKNDTATLRLPGV
jgi:transcriptional repressor NrdR